MVNNDWLVVSTYPSEKYEFVKWEYEIPIYIYIWKKQVPNHQPEVNGYNPFPVPVEGFYLSHRPKWDAYANINLGTSKKTNQTSNRRLGRWLSHSPSFLGQGTQQCTQCLLVKSCSTAFFGA